jgi:uncharacterized membrane protein
MYKTNIISTITLLVLDFLWIAIYMGKQYQTQINDIQGQKMKTKPFQALLAYILMVIGLNLFVLPNIRKGYELQDSLKYGLIFGIVLYGVYDFTAGAVFKKWNMELALIDIFWGGLVFFISAYIGRKFGSY